MRLFFARFLTKNTICWKVLRKFSKIFIRNLLKMHYFCIFFQKFNKPLLNFLRVWTKNANCWAILRKFCKFLMIILFNNWMFILFLFSFFFYFSKLLLKLEPSDITPVFYNNFFGFGGGEFPPFPPLATPLLATITHLRYFYHVNSPIQLKEIMHTGALKSDFRDSSGYTFR